MHRVVSTFQGRRTIPTPIPRPVKQFAVLLLVRGFHFAVTGLRLISRVAIASGHMLVAIVIAIGGPMYRWMHALRLRSRASLEYMRAHPKIALGAFLVLVTVVGSADSALNRSPSLDPFGSRILFQLLDTNNEEGAATLATDPDALGSEGSLAVTTMINGDTAVLKPQILSPLATRKTPTTYRIASGDTLSSIAERFGLKLTTILWENKLSLRSTLRLGQELTILPVDGVRHTVKSGDTVAAIAKRYQTEPEKILSFNGLKEGTTLRLAMDLIVPDGRPAYVAPPVNRTRLARVERFLTRTFVQPAQRLGNMLWPTQVRRLTQYFSWRHPGIDIKGAMGTPVYAAIAGVVREAGWNRGGYGNQVVLEHPDGKQTRYAHLSKINTSVGTSVKQGAVIGLVGSTGRSTGPHLHFEVIAGSRRLNPMGLLR